MLVLANYETVVSSRGLGPSGFKGRVSPISSGGVGDAEWVRPTAWCTEKAMSVAFGAFEAPSATVDAAARAAVLARVVWQ